MTTTPSPSRAAALAGLLALTGVAALTLTTPVRADTVLFSDDFSDDGQGWTLGPEWEMGPAMASTGHGTGGPDPATDHTPTDDNGVAGVVIGGNASTTVHPSYWLTSPALDTSATIGPLWLEFERWLNSDYAPFMQNHVQVFDGDAWITIWQSGPAPGIADSSWTHIQYDISAFKSTQTQVRFGVLVGSDGVFPASSWNLDDVVISVRENTPPIVADDAWNTGEDQLLAVAAPGVLGNDLDTEALTVSVVSPPAEGDLVLSPDGSFTYQPMEDFSGQDQFTYEACDAGALCDIGSVTLTVAAVNDPPIANDDADTILVDQLSIIDVLANDTDVEGDTLEVSLFDAISSEGGSVSCTTDGACTYTPLAGFAGTDTYTYSASDGELEDTATVTVEVQGAAEPEPSPGPTDPSPTPRPTGLSTSEPTPTVAPTPEPSESASATNMDGLTEEIAETGTSIATPTLVALLLLILGAWTIAWSNRIGVPRPRPTATRNTRRSRFE